MNRERKGICKRTSRLEWYRHVRGKRYNQISAEIKTTKSKIIRSTEKYISSTFISRPALFCSFARLLSECLRVQNTAREAVAGLAVAVVSLAIVAANVAHYTIRVWIVINHRNLTKTKTGEGNGSVFESL